MRESAENIAHQKQHTDNQKNASQKYACFGYAVKQVGNGIHISPSSVDNLSDPTA
jgi:hypothetical protein